jgi:trehalose synthase
MRAMAASPTVSTVPVPPLDPWRLGPFLGAPRVERLQHAADELRERLAGRRVVSVNSTATGGGVAEMLQTLLGYVRGAGLATEWLVIQGEPEFFAITKRIHNGLYGGPGDGGDLGGAERAAYERTLAANLGALRAVLRPGDILLVHDPQPAGLVPALLEDGYPVVWRCHVGVDESNGWSERAWEFVRPYVEHAHGFVFSRRSFAPGWIDGGRLTVIPPSIDPLAPKNEALDRETVLSILAAADLLAPDGAPYHPSVLRRAQVVREGGAPRADIPLVVQVSRWDRMKDMAGVLHGFVAGVRAGTGAELVLAGPAVSGVSDDPEGLQIWEETAAIWRGLPAPERERVHLAAVPMDDPVENALVINALQRHAEVVVQKSLAEGFGLTVSEAMWKSRPVVASAVGGIADQIVDGESGLLLENASDLDGLGRLVSQVLESPTLAARLGENARHRVVEHYLPDRQLLQYATLLGQLLEREGA